MNQCAAFAQVEEVVWVETAGKFWIQGFNSGNSSHSESGGHYVAD